MARRYSGKKGKSGSTKPVNKVKPSWLRYNDKEVEQLVIKLAKTGKSSSEIGIILRDTYGIPDVKTITNKNIMNILKENKLGYALPEDIIALIKREIKLLKHVGSNKKDMPAKRGITLTESKILRLVKYYKRTGKIPQTWNFSRENINLLLE
jgi:small subunit ribosomal protein S15